LALGVLVVVASWPASFGDWRRWWAVPCSLVLLVIASRNAERERRRGFLLPWVAVFGALGVTYLCVPETDQFVPVVVVIAVAAVADRITQGQMPEIFLTTSLALVLWAGLYGATARQGAIVGALMAFFPAAVALAAHPRLSGTTSWMRWFGVLTALVASALVARTAGLGASLGRGVAAAFVAVVVWVLLVGAAGWIGQRRVRHTRPDGRSEQM
jgi:hypothetical protein